MPVYKGGTGMRRILKTILMIIAIIVATPGMRGVAKEPIKVVIDQRPVTLAQPPVLEEGRVFLPLRRVFEALGSEVDWDSKTQSVTGRKGNTVIKLEIGKRQATVNNEKVLMDVAGKIINGRTMVPIRFVAENLGVDVNWDDYKQMVIITTTHISTTATTVNLDIITTVSQDDTTIYKNTNFKDDYVKILVKRNNTFEIIGKTLSGNTYVLVEITDMMGKEIFNTQSKINVDGTFNQEYSLTLSDGQYIVNVFMNNKKYGTYKGTDTGLVITKVKDTLVFETSSIYEDNLQQLSTSNQVSSSDLNLHSFSEENKNRLFKLATSITKDQDTDYQKALAIAQWVSENIYYDVAVVESGKFGKIDAIGTLDEKRSVCQGYAALTSGLLRSIGIPTKQVFGHSLVEINNNGAHWDQVDHTRPNHVWNEVFADGRWVIVDTTWNSSNRYEKGEYITGNTKYAYFDPTVEAFSNTHKITNR